MYLEFTTACDSEVCSLSLLLRVTVRCVPEFTTACDSEVCTLSLLLLRETVRCVP